MANTLYFFDDYRLDAGERTLTRAEEMVALTPKAFDTLLLLVENNGHVVSKELVMSKVWPQTFIEENNLAVHISILRKTLTGDGEKEYIKTVPKRGYMFTAEVREEHTNAKPARPGSLAILPFKVEDANADDQQRAVGLADSIITRLSQIGSIAVSPTSSVMKYANRDLDPLAVAKELRVDSILSGRLARVGDRLRLNVQLIGVETGSVLWADRLDADSTDAFLYEDIISKHLAHSLDLHLTGEQLARITKRHTESGDAYQAYLQGRYYFARRTAQSLKKALECFERATVIDSNYAPAYSGLADCYMLLNYYSAFPTAVARPRVSEAVKRALEVDDALAETQASAALAAFWFDWDWPRAQLEFERAIVLNPGYASARQWYCWYLCAVGEFERAEKQGQLALETDPLSPHISMGLGQYYFLARRMQEAIDQCRRVLTLDETFLPACYFLGQAYVQQGRFSEAIAIYEVGLKPLGSLPLGTAVIAHAQALSGNRAAAEKAREDLKSLKNSAQTYVPAFAFALIELGLGNHEAAIDWLHKAFDERFIWLVNLQVDPIFDPLRDYPEFERLIRQMRFPGRVTMAGAAL